MANDLTNFNKEVWGPRVQNLLHNNLVSNKIANFEAREFLKNGDKIHRPYHSEVYGADYTKGTSYSTIDVTTTDESLSVDQVKIIPIYVDDIDDVQNSYRTVDELSSRAAYELRDLIDRSVLSEVSNAALSNTAVALSTSNIVSQFSNAKASLASNGVELDRPIYSVIDPDTCSLIEQYMAANGYMKQDETLKTGYGFSKTMGQWLGLDFYVSQNLPSSVSLGMATEPTADDTVVINGVTFTFKATASAAGHVKLSGTAATTVDRLVAAINGSGTGDGSDYFEISAVNRAKLKRRGVTATDATTSITIAAAGKMTLSETLTDATDAFGTQTVQQIVGQYKNIDLVMQKDVNTKFKDVSGKLGTDIVTWALYGKKTFVEGAQRMFKLTANYS